MSRKINRDTHKKVSSTGYQKMQGDLEVQGNLLGPAITNINAAIAKISATAGEADGPAGGRHHAWH
jgi:hypothetical protein